MSHELLAQRVASLRSKLRAFDYQEPLGVDSLDLVERLFRDLVSTTEVYQQLHEQEERLTQELALAQAQLFPLRKDNARLTRENNELHRDSITLAEECDAKVRNLTIGTRKLESQLAEMKFLHEQNEHKISSMGEEAEQMRMQIQSLSAGIDGIPDVATEMIKQAKRAGPADFEVVNNVAKRRGGGGGDGGRRAKRGAMEMTAPLSLSHPQPGSGGGDMKKAVSASVSDAELDGGRSANAAAAERMRAHIIELEGRMKAAEEAGMREILASILLFQFTMVLPAEVPVKQKLDSCPPAISYNIKKVQLSNSFLSCMDGSSDPCMCANDMACYFADARLAAMGSEQPRHSAAFSSLKLQNGNLECMKPLVWTDIDWLLEFSAELPNCHLCGLRSPGLIESDNFALQHEHFEDKEQLISMKQIKCKESFNQWASTVTKATTQELECADDRNTCSCLTKMSCIYNDWRKCEGMIGATATLLSKHLLRHWNRQQCWKDKDKGSVGIHQNIAC